MRTHLLLASAALVALLALAAPAALAQGTTTAAITGTVRDDAGLELPGATVTAVHTPSGTEYRAATRGDGGYDLRGLRLGGPYRVTASFIGFADAVEEGFELALGQTQTVDLTLAEEGSALGEVEVVADAAGSAISTDRTGASTNVTEADIENLPTIARSLADFARLSPLASANANGTSIGGRNNRFNNIQIDGATLNDVFGLAGSGTPGGQSGTQPVSLDAVEQFNVEVAPFDVRYGNFTGGLVNVVTRSGTNNFSGSARFLTRDESLVGDRARNRVLIPQSPFTDNIYIATLGGPIVRNKLFFFLSGELAESSFPNETGLLGSSAANIFPASTETLGEVIRIAQDEYGFDAGSSDLIANDRTSGKVLAKLDWNINPANRFSLRHNYVRAGDDQGNTRNTGRFDLSNRTFDFRSTQNSTAAQLNSTFGGRASNEARLVYTAIRDNREVPEGLAFPETFLRLSPTEVVGLGIDRSSQANALDQDLFEFTDNLSVYAGRHTLTLGTSNQLFRFRNLFIQDFYGAYEFEGGFTGDLDADPATPNAVATGIDAFRLGSPSRYRFSYASEYAVNDAGQIGFVCARDLADVDRDGDRLERFAFGSPQCDADNEISPDRSVNAGARPEATFTAGQLGLYLQDEWKATDDLRVTLGLRADLPVFPSTPVVNPLVSGTTGARPDGTTFDIAPAFREEAYVRAYATANGLNADATVAAYNGASSYTGPRFTDYGALRTDEVPNGNLLFSPRIGLNYRTETLGDLALQVRGGTGLFAGRTPYVWISNQYSNTGAEFARLDQRFTTAAPAPFGFFSGSADPAMQPVPGVAAGLNPVATSALALTSPDFDFPQVWRTNLGLDQELGGGFVATVEGIYTKSLSDVGFVNLNVVPVGTAADGRPLYSALNATGFTGVPRVNGNFIDSILLDNTDEGYEYNLVAQIQRRAPRGLGGSLSYTYGRAFAVNNATSSVAYSNWRFNEARDPNDLNEVGTADFEVRHRALAYASYRAEYAGRLSTQFGVVLDVRAGEPFSYIYANDANGDAENSNDLIYVPATANDVFLTQGLNQGTYASLDAYIRGEPGLNAYRGQIVPRNSGRGPAQARLDLEVTQGIETIRGQRVDFELTLVNALNLIDADFGAIRFANNQAISALSLSRYIVTGDVGGTVAGRVVTQDDIGKPVVSFADQTLQNTLSTDRFSTSDLQSRWQLRFGVRYSF